MYWACFLHIYQPPNQQPDILERIVNESYRPLIRGFKKIKSTRVTLNINGVLTKLLAKHGYSDVIEGFKDLSLAGKLEFTGSGMYHPFLPLIPKREMIRQIKLNDQVNRKFFGKAWRPRGFFPPEMGFSRQVLEVVADLGFEWIIIDEIAFGGKIDQVAFDKTYLVNGLPLKVYFRERRTSNLIMGALVRRGKLLLETIDKETEKDRYLLTAMDGETFGHHRPGLEKLLFDLLETGKLQKVLISDLAGIFPETREIEPVPSSWASSEQELAEGKPFLLWQDPKNRIHQLQWRLTRLAIKTVWEAKGRRARHLLDKALNCSSYWWASPYGWWSLEMIEQGAYDLLETVRAVPEISQSALKEAESLYQKIVSQAFNWQRTGLIRKLQRERESFRKIPFKKRAKPGEYEAILAILKAEEKKAAACGEYEQAIKWRDAAFKLEKELDIYDTIHVVDQLRAEMKLKDYERLTRKFRDRYKSLSSGQPE